MGGAAGGQALAHGVKVIDQLQALAIARQDERNRLLVLVQGNGADVIGEQRTRAVELAAIGTKVFALAHQARGDGAVGTAQFPAGIADYRTLQIAREPTLALLLGAFGL